MSMVKLLGSMLGCFRSSFNLSIMGCVPGDGSKSAG